LLGGAAYGNSESIAGAPQRVLDEFLDGSVDRTTMTASAFIKDGDPKLANDGFSNTSWATELKDGVHANFLEARFAEPIRLVYVFITKLSSEPRSPAELRPSKVLISVRYEGAKEGMYQNVAEVEVADDEKRHGFYVGADNVKAVRLTVMEPNSQAAKSVSIAGVQFSER
jgi:hypothetical protein